MNKIQNILLYLLFFSVNFGMWQPIGNSDVFSIVKFVGVLYLFCIILTPTGFFSLPHKFKPIYFPLVIFVAFLTVMNIANINIHDSRWFNIGMIQWTIMLLMMINHERMRPGSLEKGMLFFAFGAFLISMMFYFDIGIEVNSDGRATFFGENSNAMGIRMGIGSIIMLYNILYNPLKLGSSRYLLLLTVIPMTIFLVNTGSRIALLSILGMLLFMTFVIRISNVIIRVFYMMLVVAVLGMTIRYSLSSEVIASRFERTIEEGNLSGRDDIWHKIIPLIAEHPVVGVGETGYTEYCTPVFGEKTSPHNVFLELMCYTGIIGTLIYLIFIFMLGKGAWYTLRKTRSFLPIVLFIPILGLMMSGQTLNVKTIWCLYAYIAGTYIASEKLFSNSEIRKLSDKKTAVQNAPK